MMIVESAAWSARLSYISKINFLTKNEAYLKYFLGQWFLTRVRSNPRGSVSQFQEFGGVGNYWGIWRRKKHILFFQLQRVWWMHV